MCKEIRTTDEYRARQADAYGATSSDRAAQWLPFLEDLFKEQYVLVQSEKRWSKKPSTTHWSPPPPTSHPPPHTPFCFQVLEMALAVFVKKSCAHYVSDVKTATQATGIAGVVANKGGICIRMTFDALDLAFVSAHLAAHEEEKYVLARNNNVRDILRGIRTKLKGVDLYMQCHHVFWMGDLNYRIDPDLLSEHTRSNSTGQVRGWG